MPIHIKAESDSLAEFCLLPGDPDRAAFIAENFFDNPARYTEYRKMFGYTGTYKGFPVSVQTSGMGCPSISIIAEELHALGVKHMLRVGTCGGLSPVLRFGDIIIANSAWGVRSIVEQITECPEFSPTASHEMLFAQVAVARQQSVPHHVGPICSTDLFYQNAAQNYPKLSRLGCLAMEMEAAALFSVAAAKGFQAGCLLTVSDLIYDPENPVRASEEKIMEGVEKMVRIALNSFIDLENQH